jgi:hypothetical protein
MAKLNNVILNGEESIYSLDFAGQKDNNGYIIPAFNAENLFHIHFYGQIYNNLLLNVGYVYKYRTQNLFLINKEDEFKFNIFYRFQSQKESEDKDFFLAFLYLDCVLLNYKISKCNITIDLQSLLIK